MREIKFRAKSSGSWHYGFYVHFDDKDKKDAIYNFKCNDFIVSNSKLGTYNIPITETETLGQYVGVKDKNGNDIYEGDILEYKNVDNTYCRYVEWNHGCFRMTNNRYGFSNPISSYLENSKTKIDDWEIIGNVHDNPELKE